VQGILDGFRGKIKRIASQYRDAYQALLALDPAQKLAPNWKQYFLPLSDRDLGAPMRDDLRPDVRPSEGQTRYSWIWMTSHPPPLSSTPTATSSGDPQPSAPVPLLPTQKVPVTDSVALDVESRDFDRVQWAKCQARAERYEEEVQLTVEEMGRTLRYFGWKRDRWLSLRRENGQHNHSPGVQAGLRAYACRQSHLYNELISSFVAHWRTYLTAHSFGSSWLSDYASRVNPVPARPSRGHRKEADGLDPIATNIPASSKLPIKPKPLVDARLNSGSDNESEGGGNCDAEGDMERSIHAEEMFADD
jgi:hypothetical protein